MPWRDNEVEAAGSPGGRPSRYLWDRCTGKSKWGGHDERPPCPMCYVPLPVYWCSPVLEQNRFCRFFGRVGLLGADLALRRKIVVVGILANCAAFVLTFYACFSIASRDPNLLRAASFTEGILKINGLPSAWHAHVGLRAVAVTDASGLFAPTIVTFDEFCERFHFALQEYVHDAEVQCGGCQSESSGLVKSMIMSLVMLVPSINTDITRSFKNYDVNCQKFFGGVVAMISAFLSLYTLLMYNRNCFSAFHDGYTPLTLRAESILRDWDNHPEVAESVAQYAPEDGTVLIDMEWRPGPGLICTFAALALKVLDVVTNFLIPAPSIARDRDEQMEYERLRREEADMAGTVPKELTERDGKNEELMTEPPSPVGGVDSEATVEEAGEARTTVSPPTGNVVGGS